jgi:hypothetical protein
LFFWYAKGPAKTTKSNGRASSSVFMTPTVITTILDTLSLRQYIQVVSFCYQTGRGDAENSVKQTEKLGKSLDEKVYAS